MAGWRGGGRSRNCGTGGAVTRGRAAAAGAAEPPSATPTLRPRARGGPQHGEQIVLSLSTTLSRGRATCRARAARTTRAGDARSGRGGSPTEQDTPRPDIAALNPGRPCRRWLWRRPGVVAARAAPAAASQHFRSNLLQLTVAQIAGRRARGRLRSCGMRNRFRRSSAAAAARRSTRRTAGRASSFRTCESCGVGHHVRHIRSHPPVAEKEVALVRRQAAAPATSAVSPAPVVLCGLLGSATCSTKLGRPRRIRRELRTAGRAGVRPRLAPALDARHAEGVVLAAIEHGAPLNDSWQMVQSTRPGRRASLPAARRRPARPSASSATSNVVVHRARDGSATLRRRSLWRRLQSPCKFPRRARRARSARVSVDPHAL